VDTRNKRKKRKKEKHCVPLRPRDGAVLQNKAGCAVTSNGSNPCLDRNRTIQKIGPKLIYWPDHVLFGTTVNVRLFKSLNRVKKR
jgi:hypothetical protein